MLIAIAKLISDIDICKLALSQTDLNLKLVSVGTTASVTNISKDRFLIGNWRESTEWIDSSARITLNEKAWRYILFDGVWDNIESYNKFCISLRQLLKI